MGYSYFTFTINFTAEKDPNITHTLVDFDQP